MPEKINWTLNVQIGSALKTSLSQTVSVDAYDVIRVTIHQKERVLVQVQPGEQVQFLLISSSAYEGLSYYLDPNDDSAVPIRLDGPQLFVGGAVQLLGKWSAQELSFESSAEKPASISVLVGRKAIK